MNGVLTVEVLTEGVHSGDASGVVPSSFRIARMLLERIDDADTGASSTPPSTRRSRRARRAGARAAEVLGEEIWRKFPVRAAGMQPMHGRPGRAGAQPHLAAALAVTGADGCRAGARAGQRAAPEDRAQAVAAPAADGGGRKRRAAAEGDPRDRSAVRRARDASDGDQAGDGWNAPPTAPWLEKPWTRPRATHFGKPAMWMGEGGTIPFMGMLGAQYPQAQFLITGVLGPHSNAHGPNEFLHAADPRTLHAEFDACRPPRPAACRG